MNAYIFIQMDPVLSNQRGSDAGATWVFFFIISFYRGLDWSTEEFYDEIFSYPFKLTKSSIQIINLEML